MLDKLKTWINNMATEMDNKTICPIRVTALGGTLYTFICHAYNTFFMHVPFDMIQFSGGLSAIIGTLGLALGLKKENGGS